MCIRFSSAHFSRLRKINTPRIASKRKRFISRIAKFNQSVWICVEILTSNSSYSNQLFPLTIHLQYPPRVLSRSSNKYLRSNSTFHPFCRTDIKFFLRYFNSYSEIWCLLMYGLLGVETVVSRSSVDYAVIQHGW